MFAATTVDSVCITDPTTLKKPPPSLNLTAQPPGPPTATAWSSDNSYLYLASSNTIFRYDPESHNFEELYSVASYETVQHIAVRDVDTLIFATADKVHVLDISSTPEISQTFDTHKDTITSISISNDGKLLSSTSASSIHVHKLSDGSLSILQGGTISDDIQVSSFHLHLSTKLLVGAGKDLVIFDVAKRTAPVKTIPLSDSTIGSIVAVACSPFSKSLVAVATSGGSIGLIDLEKEKSLFRTLMVQTPLTTIGFSPEGAAIYLGTATGKLLIVDLRALDKPPKTVVISQDGNRIQTMSVQRKLAKSATDTKTPLTTTTKLNKKPSAEAMPITKKGTTSTVSSATRSKVASSPVRTRAAKPVTASPVPPRRIVATTKPTSNPVTKKVAASPKRNINDSSDDTPSKGQSDTPSGTPKRGSMKASVAPLSPPTSTRSSSAAGKTETLRRTRTLPNINKPPSPKSPPSVSSATTRQTTSRTRAASSSSRAGTEAASAASSSKTSKTTTTSTSRPASASSRPGSSISQAGKPRRGSSPVPPLPSVPKSSTAADTSPALSFEVPEIHLNARPTTPQGNERRAKSTLNVLGMGTPEVEKWIRAGSDDGRVKGKGKSVGFKEGNLSDDEDGFGARSDDDGHHVHDLSVQISPLRNRGTAGGGMSNLNAGADTWAASPGTAAPGTTSSAHELLRTIVQDVMCDFQQETKAEMMGLHLDLLNMGRGLKSELRSLMQEYVGDLKELREENARLREENARLRRGAY
ncbi:hypothetical protein CVT24_011150 [Panaeolus cyanescens]|uniref:Anaphase-promoting complex subunit 4 WD40 domain-containing protein n=1 Tax=Panaeolus cyanescens TaxID=181874 RepID=A0A409YGB4_9AGAR|nr:hypothetical protein CVT24_011150 [Panaeolus cyanescens]